VRAVVNIRTVVRILISAGEASGDMYAAQLAGALRPHLPEAHFYGCAGPHLKAAGVEVVLDSASLAVVGLAEVVSHLPRIYWQYRRLLSHVRRDPPAFAILADSPDFHLRLARHLKSMGIPVFYLVAPQVWAWRQGRVKTIRERVDKLFCLFPFEECWFRERGVDADYIGHPLAARVRPALTKPEFFARHGLDASLRTVVLLPGSRVGEATRHLPDLLGAIELLRQKFAIQTLLATPSSFAFASAFENFRERFSSLSIKVIEGETWDCLAYSDLAFAASGTVTVEAAVLGTPMVTFYKVTPLSWWAGRRLVKVPYLSMVNLIADRRIVPELIQNEMTPAKLASSAADIFDDPARAQRMRIDLAAVCQALRGEADPLEKAATLTLKKWDELKRRQADRRQSGHGA
jgi:lipid-A-disaccharide synthase